MMFALLHFGGEDYQCAIRNFTDAAEYNKFKQQITETYDRDTLTDVVRLIDEYFGKQYYTLKDLFVKEKKEILHKTLADKMDKFTEMFKTMYSEGRHPIKQLKDEGVDMAAIDIGIGHKDDLVIAQLVEVDLLAVFGIDAKAYAQCLDDIVDLFALKCFVPLLTLHIEYLTAQGQDGLELA